MHLAFQALSPLTVASLTPFAYLVIECEQAPNSWLASTPEKSYIDSIAVTVYNSAMSVDYRAMTIEEIAELTGLSVRTIRYYISEGLLPGPGTRGKGTAYSEEHLLRLQLIRVLSEQRVPLAEIREQLTQLSISEIKALLGEESHRLSERKRASEAESPRQYISALLSQARIARLAPPQMQNPASSRDSSGQPGLPAPVVVDRSLDETWHRLELTPGIELHVRSDARGRQGGLIEELLRVARAFRRNPNG